MTVTSPAEPGSGSEVDPGPSGEERGHGGPGATSPTAAVAAGLAVPGLDLRTARQVVDLRARRRVRRRRSVLAGATAVAVVALGVALFPHPDPDHVVADADSSTTTSSTTTTAVPITAPVTTVPPVTTAVTTTTVKAPVITLPVTTTTMPTTTVPPVQPITVDGYTVAGTAGSNLVLTVNWTDPTPGPAPDGVKATVVWGSGVVTTPDTQIPCTPAGTPLLATNRYASVGQPLIQVEITRCSGTGDSAELKLNANVPAPTDGYVVVVGGAAGGRSPDAATVDAGSARIDARMPDLGQTDTTGRPVTVLTVPSGYEGPLVFRWPDGSCQQTPDVSPSTSIQPTVLLGQTACPAAGTGSTVP